MEPETKTFVCKKHGEYQGKEIDIFGKKIKQLCPKCRDDIDKIRDDAKTRVRRRTALESVYLSFPKRYIGKSFDDWITKTKSKERNKKIAVSFANKIILGDSRSLIFSGGVGTGKTFLATIIANEIAKSGLVSRYVKVSSLMRRIKSTYQQNASESESDIFNELVKPDLLVIDEVGLQYDSKHEQIVLTDIIDERYCNNKPTLVITNADEQTIHNHLTERAIDRLREASGVVKFDWESMR